MTADHVAADLDPACAMAHGDLPAPGAGRLVAVFASPVAEHLLHFGADLGYQTALIEPDPARLSSGPRGRYELFTAVTAAACGPDADIVVTDHDRAELGDLLAAVLARSSRWVGVMGSPRHSAPHLVALRDRGVAEADIDRVHRPIGLNIGSTAPAEIAVATLAGLIADRNHRPGGFDFAG